MMGSRILTHISGVLLFLLVSVPVLTVGETRHKHEQVAHVHGTAELTVAVAGNEVEIMLQSPAANLIGFEHRPTTRAQIERVQSALKILDNYENLVRFEASDCKAILQDVQLPFEHDADHAAHEHHAERDDSSHEERVDHQEHNHQGHDHHGSHDKHDDHDESKEGSKQDAHSEIAAVYQLGCGSRDPESVFISIFDSFPGIEKLQVQWISNSGQGAATLTGQKRRLNLR